jgi:hypothetical protein
MNARNTEAKRAQLKAALAKGFGEGFDTQDLADHYKALVGDPSGKTRDQLLLALVGTEFDEHAYCYADRRRDPQRNESAAKVVNRLLEDDQDGPRSKAFCVAAGEAAVGDRIMWECEPGDTDFATVTAVKGDTLVCASGSNKSRRPVNVARGRVHHVIRWRRGGQEYNNIGEPVG